MKLKLNILFLLVIASLSSWSQRKLSEEAEVAVITIGPYQGVVYSAFGHSGIRVYDPAAKRDWFFNYGLYDFEQENFFLNFAQGLLKYKVGVSDYQRNLQYHNKIENRWVKEQYLNLNQEEKQALFDYLLNNARPENAEYLYNYVYDNCATKIRDVAEEVFPGRIIFDLSYKENDKSVRDLMDDYLEYQPWGDFGIDLGLGMQIDGEATAREYMFLPDYIFEAFANARLTRDSTEVPLVIRTKVVEAPKAETYSNGLLTPLNVFIFLFFIVGFVTNRNFKTGRRTRWLDAVLFSFVGFLGLWVAYLWIGTEHLSKSNLNILWAIPFHLPVAFLINRSKLRRFMRIYFKVTAYWYCLLLVVWALLPQPLGMSLVPLVLAMVLRAFYIGYDLKEVRPAGAALN